MTLKTIRVDIEKLAATYSDSVLMEFAIAEDVDTGRPILIFDFADGDAYAEG